jgi:hypothetical protein
MKRIIISVIELLCINFSRAQNPAITDTSIFNSFKQGIISIRNPVRKIGGGGNCASVAVIKAAIGTFGVNKVFNSVTYDQDEEMYTIVLQNEDTL